MSKCLNCDGEGERWMAPAGVNPFSMKLPQLASIMQRKTCWRCNGTGEYEPPRNPLTSTDGKI
jgi:DnaJ-class molecular chaperone